MWNGDLDFLLNHTPLHIPTLLPRVSAVLCVLHAKSDRDSNSCRTPVLKQIGHLFQSKSDGCSNGMSDSFSGALEWVSDIDWNAIPIQVGHLFQSKSDTCSKANRTGIPIS